MGGKYERAAALQTAARLHLLHIRGARACLVRREHTRGMIQNGRERRTRTAAFQLLPCERHQEIIALVQVVLHVGNASGNHRAGGRDHAFPPWSTAWTE